MKQKDGQLYLGIDLGGSAVKFGWGNCQQGLLKFRRFELTDNTARYIQSVIQTIIHTAEMETGPEKIKAIGLGTPGTIDFSTGRLVGVNPNLTGWVNLNPRQVFPKPWRARMFYDNDANLMALSEAHLLPKVKYVLGITIGSGIGSGLVIKQHVYHGAHGFAMELGHTVIKPGGVLCNCGRRGCLEAYVAVNGLLKLVRKTGLGKQANNMQDVFCLAQTNKQVGKILSDSIKHLATAIVNAIITLDVEVVVLGGGIIEMAAYPFEELKQAIFRQLPEINQASTVISKAQQGNRAGVLGAIYLAETSFTSNRE